jgi:SAM-dependent methyltransferase
MQNSKNEFIDLINCATSSQVYLDYCTELYGYGMYLFNMMDKFQLDYLFNNISISRSDFVLDLGCGSGSILNYLVQKYQCQGIGIDQLDTGIIHKDNKLFTYVNADIDELESCSLSPDITISVDSLYFCRRLDRLLEILTKIKGNRLFLYYSQYVFDKKNQDKNILKCDHTRLAESLKKAGIKYRTIDYSENERYLYEKALQILPKYKQAFEQEGHKGLFVKKMNENQLGKELYDDNCASRYLYIIT